MISHSTPAALGGIVVGAGHLDPHRRRRRGNRPGVLSMFASTTHDPPASGQSVAELRTRFRCAVRTGNLLAIDARPIVDRDQPRMSR